METWIGIDVAKAELVVGVLPGEAQWAVANDERGIRELRAKVTALTPRLIVLEATGGYELAVVAALAESQLPVVVVNPRQVRDFAKATGELAKTDALDALVLARFGERVRPDPRPLADDAQRTPWMRCSRADGSSLRCCRLRRTVQGRSLPGTRNSSGAA